MFIAKVKGFIKSFLSFVLVGSIIFFIGAAIWAYAQNKAGTFTVTASSTPTRLQQTQMLIDSLTEQRKHDPAFIAETAKEIEDLKKSRDVQARIDALFVVKTQLDDEIYQLNPKSK